MLGQEALKLERFFVEAVSLVVIRVVHGHRVIAQVNVGHFRARFLRTPNRCLQDSLVE